MASNSKKAFYTDFRKDAEGRQRPSYLTRAPIPSRSREAVQLAKDKEAYYLEKGAQEFNRFLAFHGSPDGFSVTPKGMELCELRMAQAASAGDHYLVRQIGEKYLQRVMAYVDLWRMRLARRELDALGLEGLPVSPLGKEKPANGCSQAETPAPLEVDSLEVRSTRIPKRLELEPGELPLYPEED